MKSYTIQELSDIFDYKHYLPQPRFVHYFTTKFGYSEEQAKEAFQIFYTFPINRKNKEMEIIDEVMSKALEVIKQLFLCWDNKNRPLNLEDYANEYRKLIYKRNGETNELIIDLIKTEDILLYSDLIRQEVEQVAFLRFCCEVQYKNSENKLKIFEGDIFDTNDNYYANKSNVYIASKDEVFRKVLYTKGKGYFNKGKLNYDDETSKFNDYVLRLTEWKHIGNIYLNPNVLTDDGII
jgi:hypothetical protein